MLFIKTSPDNYDEIARHMLSIEAGVVLFDGPRLRSPPGPPLNTARVDGNEFCVSMLEGIVYLPPRVDRAPFVQGVGRAMQRLEAEHRLAPVPKRFLAAAAADNQLLMVENKGAAANSKLVTGGEAAKFENGPSTNTITRFRGRGPKKTADAKAGEEPDRRKFWALVTEEPGAGFGTASFGGEFTWVVMPHSTAHRVYTAVTAPVEVVWALASVFVDADDITTYANNEIADAADIRRFRAFPLINLELAGVQLELTDSFAGVHNGLLRAIDTGGPAKPVYFTREEDAAADVPVDTPAADFMMVKCPVVRLDFAAVMSLITIKNGKVVCDNCSHMMFGRNYVTCIKNKIAPVCYYCMHAKSYNRISMCAQLIVCDFPATVDDFIATFKQAREREVYKAVVKSVERFGKGFLLGGEHMYFESLAEFLYEAPPIPEKITSVIVGRLF